MRGCKSAACSRVAVGAVGMRAEKVYTCATTAVVRNIEQVQGRRTFREGRLLGGWAWRRETGEIGLN